MQSHEPQDTDELQKPLLDEAEAGGQVARGYLILEAEAYHRRLRTAADRTEESVDRAANHLQLLIYCCQPLHFSLQFPL